MAFPSAWRWSGKPNAAQSAIQLPSCYSNSSSFNSLHRVIHRRKRDRLTTSSLEDSQSPSSFSTSPSSPPCPPPASKTKRRPMKSGQSPVFSDDIKKPTTSGPNDAPKSSNLSLKSMFGRRSLWRRILFASRKLRSIILLNVLTVVYGMLLSLFPVFFKFFAILLDNCFLAFGSLCENLR